jgi:tRNA threonylcarbamoyladenosine biosynthesis protein TsaB
MLVLAIETATEAAGVSIADEDGVLGSVAFGRGRRHTEVLAPSVRFVCDTARTAMDQLGAVAVDIGPGLFTGLRVGVSTARALGYALGVPIVTATSLEVLAREAVALPQVQFRPGSVLAVVDVKRGEVAWQRFVQDGDGATPWLEEAERLAPPGVLVEELASAPAGSGRCLLVGDGAARYAELFASLPNVVLGSGAVASPSASVLARLGVERALAGEVAQPRSVLPRYLREADVRIHWETRPHSPAVAVPRPAAGGSSG